MFLLPQYNRLVVFKYPCISFILSLLLPFLLPSRPASHSLSLKLLSKSTSGIHPNASQLILYNEKNVKRFADIGVVVHDRVPNLMTLQSALLVIVLCFLFKKKQMLISHKRKCRFLHTVFFVTSLHSTNSINEFQN